jgi:hypothetical protein
MLLLGAGIFLTFTTGIANVLLLGIFASMPPRDIRVLLLVGVTRLCP